MYKLIGGILLTLLLSGCGSFWELVMTDDERQLLRQSAKSAAACQVSRYLQAPMWHKPLYAMQQGMCESVPLRDELWFGEDEHAPVNRFYADPLCRKPVTFQLTRYHSFCNDYALPQRLGDDRQLVNSKAWTLNPASRFRLPLVKQYGLDQPFMTARTYQQVEVSVKQQIEPLVSPLILRKGSGICKLQMHIYKVNPALKSGKPLLMFHGGGGHQRAFHLLALESRIPEYVAQGYTVYLPFYRLFEEDETHTECSGARWNDLKTDAEAALSWVLENHTDFGEPSGKVSLFAQGSGALLAGWLHTRKPNQIEKSIFFYPMLDTGSMRQEILSQGGFKDGQATLERLFGQSLQTVDDENRVLKETSYLSYISQAPNSFPPMVLLHGLNDQRIPSQQTLFACNVLAGEVSTQIDEPPELGCGDSKAFLISGASYQLDYCFSGVECPAGDLDAREEVKSALKKAHLWLKGNL